MSTVSVKVEFGGGLELLFGDKRSHSISLPSLVPVDNSIPSSTRPSSALPVASDVDSNGNTPHPETAMKPLDMQYLIHWLRATLLTERPELFMEGDTVRPGILVLVNDTDWELEGEGEYRIRDGDEVVFISTLHGG